MSTRHPWWRSPTMMMAGAALVLTALSEVVLNRMQGTPPDLLLFMGRLHPLAVHLPIGLFVLVALAEVATFSARLRSRIDPALGLILPVTVVAAFGAFVLGHLLAQSGGFASHTLSLHRRLEFFAVLGAGVSLAAWAYQLHAESGAARTIYRLVLFATFGVLSIGAHFGGTLTRGDTYLAKYAPGPLKSLLGGGSRERAPAAAGSAQPARAEAAEPLLFADVVLPVLQKRCVECHGPEKIKGKLRVDSLEALLKGGENGPVIVPGAADKSELVHRVLLPVKDDDRMPPEGKPGPTPGEIALVKFWIDRGASATQRVRDVLPPNDARSLLEKALSKGTKQPTPTATDAASDRPNDAAAPAEASTPKADEAPAPAPAASSAARNEARAASEPQAQAPAQRDSLEERAPDPSVATKSSGDALSILAEKCQKCHGPKKQKGKLRVDSLQALLRGGSEGPAVVPGNPGKSQLITRVRLPLSSDDHMPPPKEPQLSTAEINALTSWVARGIGPQRALTASAAPAPASSGAAVAALDQPPEADRGTTAEASSAEPPASQPEQAEALTPASSSGTFALFTDAVQPLLLEKCGNCHTGAKPKGRFDITTHEKLMAGGVSGPAVLAGDVQGSELMRRVLLPMTDDEHMPPEGEPALSGGDVELLKTWVELGARSDQRVDPASLSQAARQALGERRTAQKRDTSAEAVHPTTAGCAACTVGSGRASPLGPLPLLWALAAGVSGLLRVRTRRRSREAARSAYAQRPSAP